MFLFRIQGVTQILLDWQGIDYSTKWWEEICAGIEGADNFVLLMSLDSLNSKYCHQEIEHARIKAKRIIPVLYQPTDQAALIGGWYTNPEMKPFETLARENWEAIRKIQWIEYPKLGDLDKVISALLETVNTNPELTRLHTRLGLRIRDWESSGRNPDLLLRGIELGDYENWLSACGQSGQAPQPTDEQRAYIQESHEREIQLQTRNLFEALKGQALKRYVEPYLVTKQDELAQHIEETKKTETKWHFSANAEDLTQELNTIKNFLEDGGNWHPQPALHIHSGGAMDDYVEVWEFPCCGKKVVMGDGTPLQFRYDGCAKAPPPSPGSTE